MIMVLNMYPKNRFLFVEKWMIFQTKWLLSKQRVLSYMDSLFKV